MQSFRSDPGAAGPVAMAGTESSLVGSERGSWWNTQLEQPATVRAREPQAAAVPAATDEVEISLRRRPLKTLSLFTAYLFDQTLYASAAAAAHPLSLFFGCPSLLLYLSLKWLGACPVQLREFEVRGLQRLGLTFRRTDLTWFDTIEFRPPQCHCPAFCIV